MLSYIIFSTFVLFIPITSCFKQAVITIITQDGEDLSALITDNLEDSNFPEHDIKSVIFQNQDIPYLTKNTVHNMIYLEELFFYNCNITDVEPSAFNNLPNLKNIRISYSNLLEIPKYVFSLPNLEEIKINHNKIGLIGNQAFANLTKLKKFSASHNLIRRWNKNWFRDSYKLEEIDFQHNLIQDLFKNSFNIYPSLERIFLDYNRLSNINAEAFNNLVNLKYLGLSFNRLKDIDNIKFPNGFRIRNFGSGKYLPDEVEAEWKVVALDGNPWKCFCNSQNGVYDFVNHTVCLSSEYVPDCVLPSSSARPCVNIVTDKEFDVALRGDTVLWKYCFRIY